MTIDELLNLDPDELIKLSTPKLMEILAPYYPTARKALLPPDKPVKKGLEYKLISAYLEKFEGIKL